MINTVPENYFVIFFYRSLNKRISFDEATRKMVHEFNLAFHQLQPIVGYEYNDISKNSCNLNGTYKDFCDLIYSQYRHFSNHSENAKIIVDKNPANTLHLKKLKKLNPEAKFIFITRDYRANILSRMQSVHIHSTNPLYNGLRWNYFMKKALRFKRKNPSLVYQIKYENLVSDPHKIMQLLFDFIEVPSQDIDLNQDNEKVSIQNFAKKISNDRFEKKYNDLAQPVSTDRTIAWKNQLDENIIEQLDYICQPTGAKLGYLSIKQPSFFSMLKTFIISFPQLILLRLQLLKDEATDYLPISVKISRFKKFVRKIDYSRKNNK